MSGDQQDIGAQLVARARDGLKADRQRLLNNISELFVAGDDRLSEHERATMIDIIGKLVQQVETDVARELCGRLAKVPAAPRELVMRLASERVEIARPLIMQSPVLRDPDLIELVRHRTQEHRLCVAMRSGLSAEVSDVLISYGDEDVIEALLLNQDAVLSKSAIEHLVEESRRVDRFQEPLLRRRELPKRLAMRMFWWVSALLRKQILAEFPELETELDDAIEATVSAMAAEPGIEHNSARVLIDNLADRGELTGRSLVGMLRHGRVTAFIVALAKRAKSDAVTTRRIFFSNCTEAFAALCRAADIDRNDFASLFLLRRAPRAKGAALPPAQLAAVLAFYDKIKPNSAAAAVRFWMRDRDYLESIVEVERAVSDEPPARWDALPQ